MKPDFLSRSLLLAGTVAGALLWSPLPAVTQEQVEAELKMGTYLAADETPNLVRFLPPYPAWSSLLFSGDHNAYIWGKTQRNTPRGDKAVAQVAFILEESLPLFSKPFGFALSAEKTPRIYTVLVRALNACRIAGFAPKDHYRRQRPFDRYGEPSGYKGDEARLRTNGSYPSGHSARGWCMALLLTEINPSAQNDLLKTGYEWGESRVILGYHWQSDVEAGRAMASAVYARLHADEEFLADMAAARREFAELAKKR